MAPRYTSRLWTLIFLSSVLRLVVAGLTELGNDEVYYWTYSQHLQWNYFDHPPLVAIWIRAFTANLSLQGAEIFVRLGSIVSAAAGTWLIFRTAGRLHSEKAGWLAACLYTTSLYASIIAGLFILPDSPQMVFWCWSLYLIVRLCEAPRSWLLWLLFGLAAGLCIMSKVHGIFLWLGLGLFILFRRRNWFALPQVYVAALLTAVIASPILFWNMANDFITYRFHSQRVEVHGFGLNGASFAREAGGQFFYNNPVNVVILVLALVAWKRRRLGVDKTALSVFGFIALPMIALLIAVSLFRTTFPHWSGPAYVALLPLCGVYLASRSEPVSRLLRASFGLTVGVLLLGIAAIYGYPGTLGSKNAKTLGHGDFTLDLRGWREAGVAFGAIHRAEFAAGRMPAKAAIVSQKWFPAAHLDYYFCRPLDIPLIGLGSETDLHQYAWSNGWRLPAAGIDSAYAVVPSHLAYDPRETFGAYYERVDSVAAIRESRGGKPTRTFTIYELRGWRGRNVPVQR
ncbi:MAG: glycosyl transferase family protein [Flaviaesturariibacter sp.]|nr:glycosyl transferase family protein [Flaviaesturariibacter sp.]